MSAPAFATWLLQKFRPSDEALLGDLLEERPNGRSTAWYWRQVMGAIVTGSVKDIRRSSILALRAMATGWIVLLLFFACGDRFAETLPKYALELVRLGWIWSRGVVAVPHRGRHCFLRWVFHFGLGGCAVSRHADGDGCIWVQCSWCSHYRIRQLFDWLARPLQCRTHSSTSSPSVFLTCGIQASFWCRWSSCSRLLTGRPNADQV